MVQPHHYRYLSSFGGVVSPVSFHCFLGEVSVHFHKDVISSVLSGTQGDCKENGLEQRKIQNGGRDTKLLVLVNSWTQEGVSVFQ
jgi:hypothetical protein